MAFTAISDILKYKEENNCKFWEAIVQQEAKDSLVDEKTVIDKMTKMYHVMKEADAKGLDVARVHTGDPAIFGAHREQMDELDRLGIAYEVIDQHYIENK